MNRNKKLSILGLALALILYSVANGALGGSANPVGVATRAAFIEVAYVQQQHPYFCGQASVQMVLEMVQDRHVSQFRLQNEMNFNPEAGTRNIHMAEPFRSRGVEIIRNGFLNNQEQLRESIDLGQYSIINIRSYSNANRGHFVVVTGYNETGFFVHDPWPEDWGKLPGRDTGANAYMSNELLRELWAYRLNWALTVAGPNSITIAHLKAEEVPIWS